MNSNYNHWDELCKRDGHTGGGNRPIYKYDQPLRLKAIDKALSRLKIEKTCRALDIGCGSGDIIALLSKRGFRITGIDISSEVIKKAKERFQGNRNIELFCCKMEDLDFPRESFNLVTSVTALQHITDDESFLIAAKKIVDVTKEGGIIFIFESAPFKTINVEQPKYMRIRSRDEWIDIFEEYGCIFVTEFYPPRIGAELFHIYNKIIKKIFSGIGALQSDASTEKMRANSSIFYRLYTLGEIMIFKISKPFDEHFVPIPKRYRQLRILIFQKGYVPYLL